MKFTLEVDLEKLEKVAGDPVTELEHILRYWGGNMRHCHLSAYSPVGT